MKGTKAHRSIDATDYGLNVFFNGGDCCDRLRQRSVSRCQIFERLCRVVIGDHIRDFVDILLAGMVGAYQRLRLVLRPEKVVADVAKLPI